MIRMTKKKHDEIIEGIARDVLEIDALTIRQNERLDFHAISVWRIREALEAAYQAGAHFQWVPKPTGRWKKES
ncbi:hypothetical protein DF117_27480 [Burkholderia stagnalis]|nr:hypothetical protein DF117_27480 [Burkholderia stagnalis]